MNKKLLRKKLALMLANLKKPRKYYCEIEYLESTGTQYIDTGIYPANMTYIEADAQYTQINIRQTLLGCYSSSDNKWNTFGSTNPTSTYANFFVQWAANYGGSVAEDTNKHHFVFDKPTKTFTVDSSSWTYTDPTTDVTNNTLYMFAMHDGSTIDRQANAKIYCLKIKNGDTLVRDFIPVLDWNYVPCMYDKVTGQLFYNAGTGDFLYGREIHYVDYLESTGTQYIDTGISKGSVSVFRMTATMSFDDRPSANALGCGQSLQGGCFGIKSGSNNNIYFNLTGTDEFSSYEYTLGTMLNFDLDGVSGTFKVKDLYGATLYEATRTSSTSSNSTNLILFGFINTQGNQPRKQTIKDCKMYKSGVLVRDYYPAIDENGVGYMFDKVTHTIYDNAGTGAFKYPPVELEYLGNTTTQYIDVGLKADQNTALQVKFSPTNVASNYTGVMGARSGSDSKNISIGINSQLGRLIADFNNSAAATYRAEAGVAGLSSSNIVEIYTSKERREVTVDGVSLALNVTPNTETFETTGTVNLFRMNGLNPSNKASTNIYSAQMWSSGQLIRNFIPCYKDGVLGMWDKVNGVMYQNAGTGDFSKSKIVEPEYE